jgi:hypothetical protein
LEHAETGLQQRGLGCQGHTGGGWVGVLVRVSSWHQASFCGSSRESYETGVGEDGHKNTARRGRSTHRWSLVPEAIRAPFLAARACANDAQAATRIDRTAVGGVTAARRGDHAPAAVPARRGHRRTGTATEKDYSKPQPGLAASREKGAPCGRT